MQNEASDRFLAYQKEVEEEKRLNKEMKKQNLEFLKNQMENDLKRREEEKLKIKQEDQKYIENVVNRNSELSQKQSLLKQIVKEEIIQEYEALNKKAEERESAAKLKIQELSKILIPNQKVHNQKDSSNVSTIDANKSVFEMSEKINDMKKVKSETQEKDNSITMIELNRSKVEIDKSIEIENSNKMNVNVKINEEKSANHTINNRHNPDEKKNSSVIYLKNGKHPLETSTVDSGETNEYESKMNILKKKNLHGHSSDSLIQDIIYNRKETIKDNNENENKLPPKGKEIDITYKNQHNRKSKNAKFHTEVILDEPETEINKDQKLRNERFLFFSQKDSRVDSIVFDDIIKPYETNINFLFELPVNTSLMNLKSIQTVYFKINLVDEFMANSNYTFKKVSEASFEQYKKDYNFENDESNFLLNQGHICSFNYIEIDDILNRILFKPIQIQSELVNKCLINYFLFDLNLENHLEAIRKYFLFENGEFAQVLVDQLSESLFSVDYTGNKGLNSELIKPKSQFKNLLNPIYVYEALNKAVSQVKNCKYIDKLSIFINNSSLNSNDDSRKNDDLLMLLNCLELKYKVDFPLNLVINQKSIAGYNKLFTFLLQIKFVMHSNKNIWYTLKKIGIKLFYMYRCLNYETNFNQIF